MRHLLGSDARLRPRWVLAAGLLLLALLGVPTAVAGAAPRFTAPGNAGPVDFGDRVQYRLSGPGCADDAVRAVVSVGRRSTASTVSRPARDPLAPVSCVGIVGIPSERSVRALGWDAGDRLEIALVSKNDRVPLRYQRIEVDHGRVVAGTAQVVTPAAGDPRGGRRDRAMEMTTGDVVSLGRVDLSRIYSISLRVCLVLPKPHVTPSYVELRAGAPDGPAIVGPVDVADDAWNSTKSNFGWPNCWQLQPWPVTGQVPGRAPELYLAMVATAGPVQISYLDVNGTGAKIPDGPPADPPGTKSIFDGTSFRGWEADNCALDEGAVRPVHSRDPKNYAPLATFGFVGEAGCSMTYTARRLHNTSIRFEYRLQDFAANGAIMVGGHEIQMREAGEWLTGGFLGSTIPTALTNFAIDDHGGGYPAQRIKSNSYPDWSWMEITQVGSRFRVRINGRTVTDCSDCAPDPEPYTLSMSSQPNFSYHYGVNGRMDNPNQPYVDQPSNWGNLYFRNIRVYDCTSPRDPVCVGGPGVQG